MFKNRDNKDMYIYGGVKSFQVTADNHGLYLGWGKRRNELLQSSEAPGRPHSDAKPISFKDHKGP